MGSRDRGPFADRSLPESVDEVGDAVVCFQRMTQVTIGVDAVVVAASHLGALDVPAVDEVTDDELGRAGRDADLLGDRGQGLVGVGGQAQQDVRVVGQERPRPASLADHEASPPHR